MPPILFQDIEKLYTLGPAAAKKGRHIKEEDLGLIEDGAILCEGGRIQWIGKRAQAPKGKGIELISLKATAVLPAFVECHTHLAFAGDRSKEFEWRVNGESYQEIARKGGGILSTVRATREISLERLRSLVQKRALRFLEQGVTMLESKSGYGLDLNSELKSLKALQGIKGPRMVSTFLGAHALPPEFKDRSAYLNYLMTDVLPIVAQEKLAERVDIFVEKGFFTPEEAHSYFTAAHSMGLSITAHVEQLSRTGVVKEALNFQPVSLDHVVHLNDEDIAAMAKSEITAVLLPVADFYLKEDYPPARRLIDAGVSVALSTDFNPGTSPTQNLSLVGLLARLQMRMSLPEVISAWTVGAASALGKVADLGSLDSGKLCDFICLNAPIEELFYSVGHHPVSSVFIEGQKVFEKKFDFQ